MAGCGCWRRCCARAEGSELYCLTPWILLPPLVPWAVAFAITWASWSRMRAAECVALTDCDSHAPCALAVDAASGVQTVVVAADAVVAAAFAALPRACWLTGYGAAYTMDPWMALVVLAAVGAAIYVIVVVWLMRRMGCECTSRAARWTCSVCCLLLGLALLIAGPVALSNALQYTHEATCTGYYQPTLRPHVTGPLVAIVEYGGMERLQPLVGGAAPSEFPVACYSDNVQVTLWSPRGIMAVALGLVALGTLLAATFAVFEEAREALLAAEPHAQLTPPAMHISADADAPPPQMPDTASAIEKDLRQITVGR